MSLELQIEFKAGFAGLLVAEEERRKEGSPDAVARRLKLLLAMASPSCWSSSSAGRCCYYRAPLQALLLRRLFSPVTAAAGGLLRVVLCSRLQKKWRERRGREGEGRGERGGCHHLEVAISTGKNGGRERRLERGRGGRREGERGAVGGCQEELREKKKVLGFGTFGVKRELKKMISTVRLDRSGLEFD